MNTLQSFAVLIGCQLAGEVIVRLLGIPFPGAVVGCVLLFGILMLRGRLPDGLKPMAEGLLRYLPLMFVPAGVGVMTDAQYLRDEWAPLAFVLFFSTVITTIATGWSFAFMTRATELGRDGRGANEPEKEGDDEPN